MHSSTRPRTWIAAGLALLGFLAADRASAVTEFRTLLDFDNDPGTGCVVSTVDGPFPGVEQVLITTVSTGNPPTVTALARQVCTGGSLGAPSAITSPFPPPWPVGLGTGTGGSAVIETYFPLSLATPGTIVRLGFTSEIVSGGTGQDALLTTTGAPTAPPILVILSSVIEVPTLGEWGLLLLSLGLAAAGWRTLRRRPAGPGGPFGPAAAGIGIALLLLGAGLAWAAIVPDGNPADWGGASPSATDPATEPTNADIVAAFARVESNILFLRIDAEIAGNGNPTATDQAVATVQDLPLAITLTGTDPDSDPLTFTVVPATGPTNGVLSGTPPNLTYTPNAGFTGADSFQFQVDDGNGGTDIGTITITVADVNEAPSFTKGPDQTVLEDAGPQTVNPWATAISPGPPSEAGQTVIFNVTGNTNPGLFSAGPAVSPAGVLTYTPAANANGSATITLTLQDNGGTLGGGVDTSAPQTFVINVTAVNDAPSFTGPDQTVVENAGPQTVDPWATAISAGPADEAGQTLTFSVTGNTNPGLFSAGPAVSSPNGVLTYTPATDANGTATITVQLADNGGTANGGVDAVSQTFTITVTGVNDAPSFTKGPDQTVNEDAGPQTVDPWATAISAGPPDEAGQTLTFNITGNTNPGLFSAGPAVSPTGVLTYTPAANANGTATITLTLSDDGGTAGGGVDTSPPQTFVITVNSVNDAPVFTKGPDQTVGEDAGPQTVDPWATGISAGPADESGQTLTFNVTGNTNPGLFTAGPAVSPTGVLTYTPAADTSGTATITLTLSDNGGTANGGVDTSAPQTFTITIADVNDAPSFVKGPDQTVNEDAGPQTVDPWATAISPGAGEGTQTVTFNVTGNTNPGLFSAGPAVSPTGVLTYTPAPNAFGTATITLVLQDNGGTANGGIDTSPPQTFVITVNSVNDAPSFTKGADQTVNEDAGPQTVDPWATAISVGPANESGQTATFNITGNTNPALFSAGPAVSPTGVLTYTPAANTSGTATITLTLSDDGGTANGGVDTSAPQTFVITVADVNDAPSFTKGPDQTVNEDAGPQTVNPWATAISPGPGEGGQTVTFNVTGNTNPTLFAAGPAVSPTGVLTYTPAADAFGTATITLVLQDNGGTANGGVDTSAPQTFVITVNAVNDAPSFTKGPDQTVNEDAGPQTVNPWATAISVGPANESSQTATFNITGNTNPTLFAAGPAVSATGVLTYTPTANTSGTATITLTLSDDGGTSNGGVDTSASQTFVITVNDVNDPPSFVKGPDVTVNEDSGPQTANPWATAISPGPGEPGQTVTFNITGNTNPALFSAGPAVSSTGVLTFTSALNAFGTATITLVLQDNGGTANGGIDTSAPQTFVITVLPINDAPVLTDTTPNYTAIGNTQLRVSGPTAPTAAVAFSTDPADVLAAGKAGPVTDVEGDTITVVPATGPTTAGGTFAIEADGDFTYHPPANFNGTDTFVIQITDDGDPAPATTNATVTIAVSEMVWYVQNNTGTAGTAGTSVDPVDTLAEAESLSGANHFIYVFEGNGNDTGQNAGITLKNGQKLLGQGVDLVVSSQTLVTGNLADRPLVTNATGNAVTVLANTANGNRTGIQIRGLRLASTGAGANAIDLTAANAAALEAEIAHNVITGATVEGIDINAGSTSTNQTFSIHDNTVTAGLRGIDVNRTAGTATITAFARNVITGATGGSGIEIVGVTFDATPGLPINLVLGDTLAIGDGSNGVATNGLVLTNVIGDLSFDQVNIFNDAGAGLRASSTGALNAGAGTGFRFVVNAAGPGSTIDSTGGPAVDVNNASFNLPLSVLESTNSTTTGVSLVNAFGGVGSSTLSVGSGLISDPGGASGIAFNVSGGTGNIAFPGPITNNSGNAVVVTGRTGDTVSFTGAINETGSGISLTGNGGATISFTGGVTASTGASTAFAATGGGTVSVTGSANTLATSTGTALNVTNTTIGASGLTFRSISAGTPGTGPVNGIVLNNTGASGGLTVAGTGGAGTGGTIQRTSGDSILLTSTQSVSLSSMNVQNSSESGILGTTVNGLNLTGCTFTNNGDDSADVGIKVNNLSGSAAFSSTSVTGSALANVFIDNTTGTISSFTISGGSYSSLGTAFGGNSILLNIRGTSVLTTGSISGVTLSNNKPARAITIQSQDTATIGDFTVQTSTFTNNGVQASFEQSGSANLSFKLLNNPTMTMTLPAAGTSHAVNVASSSTSTGGTIQGRIQGNTIGNAATPSSGSPIGSGIRVFIQGRTQATLLIDSNVIRQVPQARGIDAQFLGPLSVQPLVQSDITVTNNDVNPQDSTGFPAAAIYLAADSQGGSPVRMRSDVRSNTVPAGAAVDSLPTFLIVDEVAAAAEAQLVDTAPASANCTAQLTSTNTGSASGAAGCALIAGPINTPP